LAIWSGARKYAPWETSRSTKAGSIRRSTTNDCSEAQIVPLSNVLLIMMSFTALGMSALGWM
jgi:hypothetical protein